MTRIKAIFFDAAGTLLHAHPSVGHVYAEVLARYGPLVPPEKMEATFRRLFASRRGGNHRLSALANEGYDWWRELVFDAMGDLQIPVREPDRFFNELYWRFADADVWRLFPDALLALLEARGRGFRTALLSNWDVRLRRVLEQMDVISLFDTMVISTEVGMEKPDPRIYQLTCKRLGVKPSEALHIGDSLREDVEGAQLADLRAILLVRKGVPNKGTGVIADLCDLFKPGHALQLL